MRVSAVPQHRGAWLTNGALLLFGILYIQFCRNGVHEFHHFVLGFSADVFGQLVLFLGAIGLIERSPTDRWTLLIILAVALVARLVCVFSPAFLSTDLYRYVWDGKVQAAGINPYRYIPADPHLRFLRDKSIYLNINRRDYAHTIYPPGAQLLFLLITRISTAAAFMKLVMVGFEALTCVVLMRLLLLLGQPRERVLLYAWHPLCIWEIASSGHVDSAALSFLALALLSRLRNKPVHVAVWLGLATLIKLYPVALLPAFFRRGEWRMPAALGGVVLLGYSFYLSVGVGVLGFLPNYAKEEGIDSGARFFPLSFAERLLHADIPTWLYFALCASLISLLSLWCYRRSIQPQAAIVSSLIMATALNLCFAPHYPWYFLWLLPSLVLYPWRPAFFYVLASSFLFWTELGAPGAPLFRLNELLYSGFFLFFAYDLARLLLLARNSRRHAEYTSPAPVLAPVRKP